MSLKYLLSMYNLALSTFSLVEAEMLSLRSQRSILPFIIDKIKIKVKVNNGAKSGAGPSSRCGCCRHLSLVSNLLLQSQSILPCFCVHQYTMPPSAPATPTLLRAVCLRTVGRKKLSPKKTAPAYLASLWKYQRSSSAVMAFSAYLNCTSEFFLRKALIFQTCSGEQLSSKLPIGQSILIMKRAKRLHLPTPLQHFCFSTPKPQPLPVLKSPRLPSFRFITQRQTSPPHDTLSRVQTIVLHKFKQEQSFSTVGARREGSKRSRTERADQLSGYLQPLRIEQLKEKTQKIQTQKLKSQVQITRADARLPEINDLVFSSHSSEFHLLKLKDHLHQLYSTRIFSRNPLAFEQTLPEDCQRLLKLLKGSGSRQISNVFQHGQVMRMCNFLNKEIVELLKDDYRLNLKEPIFEDGEAKRSQMQKIWIKYDQKTVNLLRKFNHLRLTSDYYSKIRLIEREYGELDISDTLVWLSKEIDALILNLSK